MGKDHLIIEWKYLYLFNKLAQTYVINILVMYKSQKDLNFDSLLLLETE